MSTPLTGPRVRPFGILDRDQQRISIHTIVTSGALCAATLRGNEQRAAVVGSSGALVHHGAHHFSNHRRTYFATSVVRHLHAPAFRSRWRPYHRSRAETARAHRAASERPRSGRSRSSRGACAPDSMTTFTVEGGGARRLLPRPSSACPVDVHGRAPRLAPVDVPATSVAGEDRHQAAPAERGVGRQRASGGRPVSTASRSRRRPRYRRGRVRRAAADRGRPGDSDHFAAPSTLRLRPRERPRSTDRCTSAPGQARHRGAGFRVENGGVGLVQVAKESTTMTTRPTDHMPSVRSRVSPPSRDRPAGAASSDERLHSGDGRHQVSRIVPDPDHRVGVHPRQRRRDVRGSPSSM